MNFIKKFLKFLKITKITKKKYIYYTKKERIKKFLELIQDQFKYGGKKYAHSNKKESTDCLFDNHGKNWLFGTIDKYCFRYKNLARERDLLKVACYMFILWLKRGFHLHDLGAEEPINTTVDVKEKYFEIFKDMALQYINDIDTVEPEEKNREQYINYISDSMVRFSTIDWEWINSFDIFSVFVYAYKLWVLEFSQTAGEDCDTWLEEKGYGK